MYKLSQRSIDHMAGIDPRLIEIAALAITLTVIDFGIPATGGKRTAPQQLALHLAGSSPNCDGYKIESNHQTGMALDFFAYVDGKGSWSEEALAMVACAFMQAASILGYKLAWGGLWKWADLPHIELIE